MSAAALKFRDRLSEAGLDRIVDRAFAIVMALPLIAALILLATLLFAAPANAAEDAACGAKDLVAELQKSDPAAYAKLMAEGAKIKNSGARFWKLEKPGQNPDWLLGTMHLSDPRVTDLPPEAKSAYDASSTVVLESDEILDQQKAAAKLMAKPDLMFFSGTQTIKDYLDPEQMQELDAGLKTRGLTLAAVAKYKPWMLSSMMSLSTCELSRKAGGAPFLDMKLAQDGLAAGKAIKGVESMAEQIQAMASLPMTFHVKSLIDSIAYPDYSANMMETTVQLYLKGEIGVVFPAGEYFAPEKNPGDAKDMAMFEEKLITLRNRTMAERGAPILAAGNVFMAVGALHLVGDEGLVELFRKQGYTVTAVK